MLKKFNVSVARYNPAHPDDKSEIFVLPVDSPDVEHAISAAMSNAVAFTTKAHGFTPIAIAFQCVAVTERD